jgi:asparagine synthetase B (glutamine-hydrolysing)
MPRELTSDGKYLAFLQGSLYGKGGELNAEALDLQRSLEFAVCEFSRRESFSPLDLDCDCSLAFVDIESGQITCFNDPVGYRRLFYFRNDEIFAVGTRLPFLLRLVGRNWKLDYIGARIFLVDREPRWPRSIVSGVKVLPPLHRLTEKDGEIHKSSYWRPFNTLKTGNEQALIDELRATVAMSVKRKIEGRRTVLALSGGFDSTSLARIVSKMGADFTAFSMGYNVENRNRDRDVYDETEYAKRIAERLGIRFVRKLQGVEAVKQAMADLPRLLDQPGMDPATFYLMSKTVTGMGFDAMITGMGGDACFAAKNDLANKTMRRLQIASKIPFGLALASLTAKKAKGRGPFSLFSAYLEESAPETIIELHERGQTAAHMQSYKCLLGNGIVKDVNDLSRERAAILMPVMESAGSVHERSVILSIWTSPGMHHVDSVGSFAGLMLSSPFLDCVFLRRLLGHGGNYLLQTRQFEHRLSGEIPKDLMLGKKSGFTLPLNQWASHLFKEDIEEIVDVGLFGSIGLNNTIVTKKLKALKAWNASDEDPLDLSTARFFYRLIMLKNYVRANSIDL